MPQPSPRRHRRLRQFLAGVLILGVLGTVAMTGAIATNTLGAGERFEGLLRRVDRFLAGPVPDRATVETVRVTEPPTAPPTATPTPTPEPTPDVTPAPDATATPTPPPTPTPEPTPRREAVDVDIVRNHDAVFSTQHPEKDWCAPSGVQMALAVLGLVDTSKETQREIAGRVRRWEAYQDSHNGDWGPSAMALALDAYGAPGYEVRAFETRLAALRDSARAIKETNSPVILLAWRGAHTWVMTGYQADADPSVFSDATVTGAYILDPWYPEVSSIWGRSDPPGTLQDTSELVRNFLRWKRPEGGYPDRDGLFITVAPTVKVG